LTHLIYLSLGSNLGARRLFLRRALDALPPEVRVLRVSPLYETAPWGYAEQADFLNIVVQAKSELEPQLLLKHIKSIEKRTGREASFRLGPRQIDIDILFYDDLMFEKGALTIPHPRLHERAFVLVPLAELAPDLRHPQLGKTIVELLAERPNWTETVRKINEADWYENPADQ
jgi:2-amino-4-hydroxy-6-hydroxymethyldihydropteridine diphosphokinase